MTDLKWWQKAVFYQLYPHSFADGNGDGIGDFLGMIERLDYLQDLGVDAVWLSPHYPSPQFDCGYDVADYTDVNPEYGTLKDFKEFLEGAHRRGIRVILDFVPNHSSDQHPWFIESRSSRDNPKRDWYIWRDPRLSPSPQAERGPGGEVGGPPNNWYSGFGDSAWEHDPQTGQYYYHYFFKEQPDLNWRNPELKQAMWNAVRFWLDLGVDGFRLDAIGTIFEDPQLTNHAAKRTHTELGLARQNATSEKERKQLAKESEKIFKHQVELPEVQDLMKELRAVVDEYPDRMLVGETGEIRFYGDGTDELHLAFNFPMMQTERLTPAWVRANQKERLAALPPKAWPCNTLGNHDSPRIYSRYRGEQEPPQVNQQGDAMARIYLALMFTLRGTPFLYNGEEIGMTDFLLDDVSLFRDNLSVWFYKAALKELGGPPAEAVALAARQGRDKCRTPMQWANAPNAGFSPPGVQTWLPVNPNYAQGINVAEQFSDPGSLLNFYKRMLLLRKQTPALIAGDYTPLDERAKNYLAFLRHSEADPSTGLSQAGQTCLVVLNMSDKALTLSFAVKSRTAHRLFSSSTLETGSDDLSRLKIAPFEIYIGELA